MSTNEHALLQVKKVSKHAFCPRSFWLEEVEGVFLDNAHTVEGDAVHKRVDLPGGAIPAPEVDGPPWHARALWLSSEPLGVSGKLDLAEADEAGTIMPVDTKKGVPAPDGGLWPHHRVQLTLQALLLRAAGHRCERVAVWYRGARRRVLESLTPAMIDAAHREVAAARVTASGEVAPAPLIDDPRCRGCSLCPVCMPDELRRLTRRAAAADEAEDAPLRAIVPARDDAVPLHVTAHGAKIGLKGDTLYVLERAGKQPHRKTPKPDVEVGLGTLSQVCIHGTAQMTTQALGACMARDIPIFWFSTGGWFRGRTVTADNRQVHVRVAQFREARGERGLEIARVLIADKIANARTLLRRNADPGPEHKKRLGRLRELRDRATAAPERGALFVAEAEAAKRYWEGFSALMARDDAAFAMRGRTKRPPRDATNAMLSYLYAILAKDCTMALHSAGLDPYLGGLHAAHHGQPALALDLMEVFRVLCVDSVVLGVARRGEARGGDFVKAGQQVSMKPGVRKRVIRAYERRMDELITHPVFGYRVSYRQVLSIQARLLARVFAGELETMPSLRTR